MRRNRNSKYKIINFAFWIFVFTSIISDHTIIGNIGYIAFIGAVIYTTIKRRKVHLSAYIILDFLFIAFGLIHTYGGYAVNRTVATSRLVTLVLCAAFEWCLYCYTMQYKNWKIIARTYVNASLAGLIYTLVVNFHESIRGRLGSNASTGIRVFGVNTGVINSTMIGYISMICIFFVTLIFDSRKDLKKILVYDILFCIFIVLSSTRKVLIVVPIIVIFGEYFKTRSNKALKLGISLIAGLMFLLIAYLAIMNIPSLYRNIGSRVETLLTYIIEGDVVESSLRSRLRLQDLARNSIAERPWLGWGLDNFKYTLNNGGYYAHSNFYEIIVSVGVIGAIIYYSKYVYTIINCINTLRRANNEYKPIIKLMLMFIIITIVLEYWQVTYFYRMMMLPYILTNAICKISDKERKRIKL